ncbi:MAG: hypothetical protein JNL82_21710 [Myxococcales bacterium]|nr:hypothetical protein [Myxococcales bacterium]
MTRPSRRLSSLALVVPGLALAGLVARAAPSAPAGTPSAAPSPPPPAASPPAPTPRAAADARRMFATTFTNLVVYENGAGYLHAFWRTLGTAGPDTAARLQWGRGCPEISDRVFVAIHTAFSNPDEFFLIVDKAPDARQAGAYCVTSVEVERLAQPRSPPPSAAPPAPPPSSLK